MVTNLCYKTTECQLKEIFNTAASLIIAKNADKTSRGLVDSLMKIVPLNPDFTMNFLRFCIELFLSICNALLEL